jgi:hypothetical protein
MSRNLVCLSRFFSILLSNVFQNRHLNSVPKAELSAVSFAESAKEVKSARLATNLEHYLYCSIAD